MLKPIKLTVILLLLSSANFAQSPLLTLMDGGYEKETLDYKARVEADGGVVIDLKAVNDAYINAKANNYLDSLGYWYSASYGVKLIDGRISVLYSLTSNNIDVNPAGQTEAARCSLITNAFNGYAVIRFAGGQRYDLDISYLPASKFTFFAAYTGRSGTNGTFVSQPSGSRTLQRDGTIFPSSAGASFAINPTLNNSNLLEMVFDYDADKYYCFLDGVSAGSSSAVLSPPTAQWTLGVYSAEYLTADIGEIIESNTFLSLAKRTAIRSFLANKYGL